MTRQLGDPAPATDAPARVSAARRRGPTIRDVARLAEVSIGTASKALNNSGSLRQETRDRVIAVAARARLPPQRPRPEPASRPEPDRRPDLDRQLRPLHHADHGGAGGVPDRQAHGGLHVQRHRRSGARGAARRIAARQAGRRHRRHRAAAPTGGPKLQVPARRRAGDLRLHRRSTIRMPVACCPTTRAARRWPRST